MWRIFHTLSRVRPTTVHLRNPATFTDTRGHLCPARRFLRVPPYEQMVQAHFLGPIAQDGVECDLRQFRTSGGARYRCTSRIYYGAYLSAAFTGCGRHSSLAERASGYLIPLDLSGGDSCDGAHAVGNACDALGCLCGDSVSCEYYNVYAGLRLLSSLHLLYQGRSDQPRRVAHRHHSKHLLPVASPK